MFFIVILSYIYCFSNSVLIGVGSEFESRSEARSGCTVVWRYHFHSAYASVMAVISLVDQWTYRMTSYSETVACKYALSEGDVSQKVIIKRHTLPRAQAFVLWLVSTNVGFPEGSAGGFGGGTGSSWLFLTESIASYWIPVQ